MKPVPKSLPALTALASLLAAVLLAAPGGDERESRAEERPTPLSGYRFVPDRALDLLEEGAARDEATANAGQSGEEEETAATAPEDARDPDAERSARGTETDGRTSAPRAPTEVEELFPTFEPEEDRGADPDAGTEEPFSLRPETTTGSIPVVELGPGPEAEPDRAAVAAEEMEVADEAETVAAEERLRDTARGERDRETAGEDGMPSIATGEREVSPRRNEQLAFPLTLEIPEVEEDRAAVRRTVPAESRRPREQGRRDPPPENPALRAAAPAAVGVGATLGGSESDVYLDALVPFWQAGSGTHRTLLFLVPRLAGTEDETTSGSLGLGVRSLRGEGSFLEAGFPWIIGANVFYDFTRSSNDFDYNQFGAGIEWMSPFLDLRLNAYFPDTDRNAIDETSSSSTSTSRSTSSGATFSDPFPTGHTIVQPFTVTNTTVTRRTTTTRFFERYETALEGFDGEAGILLPDDLTFIPVRFYGGYYSFDNPFGANLAGPKARLEARPFSFLLLDASWYDDEELLGSSWFLGARAQVTIGGGPVPPSSSKPLHDTTNGPKAEAYNPYGDFHRRLVERIPRNYRAVLVESPFLENESRRRVSTSSSTSRSTTSGTEVIASDLVFVDGSRGALAATGTWESPRSTIQGGADLAVARLGSTGRVWTVWTQGGAGPYPESVSVTESVRFLSNAVPIQGEGGVNFGGFAPAPVVQGGFLFGSPASPAASPAIPVGTVSGYEITGGHAGSSFHGVTFVNVAEATASRNTIDTVAGDGIRVIDRGTAVGTGAFASNTITNTGGNAITFELAESGSGTHRVTDSTFGNLGGNAVRVEASATASYDVSVERSSASGLADSALFLSAADSSVGSLSASNSIFDGGGVDATASGNARAGLTVSGSRFENDPGAVFALEVSDSARLVSGLSNNVLADNRAALDLEVTGTALSQTTFSGNSVSNGSTDAVSASFAGSGTQSFAATGNEISNIDGTAIRVEATDGTTTAVVSNNTISTAIDHGVRILSGGSASVNATLQGNGIRSASGGGVQLRAADDGLLSANARNNVIEDSGTYGLQVRSEDSGTISAEIEGNAFRRTVAAAIDLLSRDNALLAVLAQANTITDSNTFGIAGDVADDARLNLTATGNTISNTTLEAIVFGGADNSSSRFEARGNQVSSTGSASGVRASYLGAHDAVLRLENNRIGPVSQDAIVVETSDTTEADIAATGNAIEQTSQGGIRMTLFSNQDQSALVRGNDLQTVGSNAVNVATQGNKSVTVFDNTIGTTGGAAVRVEMQSSGLVLEGAGDGDNSYDDATPVPFDDAGTAPFSGGAGVRINGTVYP